MTGSRRSCRRTGTPPGGAGGLRRRTARVAVALTAICLAVTLPLAWQSSAGAQLAPSAASTTVPWPIGCDGLPVDPATLPGWTGTGYLTIDCQAPTSHKPPSDCPTADLAFGFDPDPGVVEAGGTTAIAGRSFVPGSDVSVYLCSTPILLTTVVAGTDSTVSASVTIPATTELGTHFIALVGRRQDTTQSQVYYGEIQVIAPPGAAAASPAAGTLPVTGTDPTGPAASGLALVALGAAAVLGARRRTRPAAGPASSTAEG